MNNERTRQRPWGRRFRLKGVRSVQPIVEDICRVCGKYIGDTLRFLHVGVYNDCAQAPKH